MTAPSPARSREGDGLCARLLSQRGLRVLGESQAEELLKSES